MREICIDGHFVPAVIAADFYRKEKTPFSYTKDTPGYEKRKSPLRCPKILPFVFEPEVEEMAQPVHLQYNSPLNLYSKESAVEQFEQQIGPGGGAIPLPSNDKQFDPSKSQTLKYLQESEREHFGENFFDKIAQAERARVPVDQEPHWARYAREKSERARSRTPADPSQHHTPAHTPAPSNHPVHHETAREHAEKNKIFTHTTQPIDGRAYWDAKSYNGRRGRSLTRERSYPDRGYELGGLDYTKGLPIEHGAQDFYYESHRSRKEEPSRRPGFEMGGTDFGKGYVAPGPYHGHGPDPPRLRPHYSADSRSTCNAYTAPNIESVDANLLVGDTLSNQKIRHEVRHIDQSEFGTSFCPTTGFRRDHVAVRRSPAPQAETTFSVTAPRSASLGRSSAPADQKDVYWSKQAESEREDNVSHLLIHRVLMRKHIDNPPLWKEKSLRKHDSWKNKSDPRLERYNQVYVTEPNWSRNVNQRKNAWERKSYDTEARVNLPPSAKITPAVPPPWHDRAIRTHNIWQSAAQNMDQVQSFPDAFYGLSPVPEGSILSGSTSPPSQQITSNNITQIPSSPEQQSTSVTAPETSESEAPLEIATESIITLPVSSPPPVPPKPFTSQPTSPIELNKPQSPKEERSGTPELVGDAPPPPRPPSAQKSASPALIQTAPTPPPQSEVPAAIPLPPPDAPELPVQAPPPPPPPVLSSPIPPPVPPPPASYTPTPAAVSSSSYFPSAIDPFFLPAPSSYIIPFSQIQDFYSAASSPQPPLLRDSPSNQIHSISSPLPIGDFPSNPYYNESYNSETPMFTPPEHHHMHQGSQQQQQHQQSFHSSSHTTSAPAPIPAPAPQQQFGATAANLQINSGYNANQLDYVLGNQDKYGPGQRYNSLNNQINSNITNSSAIPLGSQSFNQNYSSHSQTKTTSQYSPVPQYDRNLSASHHENQQRRSVERIIPVSPVPSAGNFSQSYSTHTSSHFPPTQIGGGANYEGSAMNNYSFLCECRVIPDPIFEARSYEKSTHHEETTTKTPLPPVPVSSLEEQRSLKQMHHEEMRTIPIQPIETRFEEKRYNKTVTQTETTIPVVPIRTSYQESYNKSTKEEETRTTSVPVMQDDYEASNYNKYTHQETTKTQPLSIIPTANENYSYHTEKFSQQSQPSPAASHRSEFSSSRYSKQEKTSTTTTQQQTGGYSNQQRTETQTTNLPITRNTTYNYQQVQQPTIPVTPQISQSSYTSHTEKKESSTTPAAPISSYQYDQHHSHRQESHREETSRPVSQLSQYSEQRNYKKNYEEKTETRTIPAVAPVTSHTSSSSTNKVVNDINEVFDRKAEMNEKLPHGSISNTHNNTEGGYRDIQGHDVEYKRELTTSANPGKEYALLKEEEKRTVETPLEPGVISRHVTTKYYKKKTVTDTTTTTNGVPAQ